MLDEILECLTPATFSTAVDLASAPEHIRGFGPVKARAAAEVAQRRLALLLRLRDHAREESRGGRTATKAAA
jgi:indolepyruvate ferredoxin oxidoreductase